MTEELNPAVPSGHGSRWAATLRRWFEALNVFLEKAFLKADVDTGC